MPEGNQVDAGLIYRDQSVIVSNTLVRVGRTSYPVNGIASVSISRPLHLIRPLFCA